jgi:hypothetical protein
MTTKSRKSSHGPDPHTPSQLKEAKEQIEQLEHRLQGSFEENQKLQQKTEQIVQAWDRERCDLKEEIKRLQEEVKHERRRATQALDVAESTSDAAGGIGRLLRSMVDDNVLEQLRLAHHEREQKYRESMRHRRPG